MYRRTNNCGLLNCTRSTCTQSRAQSFSSSLSAVPGDQPLTKSRRNSGLEIDLHSALRASFEEKPEGRLGWVKGLSPERNKIALRVIRSSMINVCNFAPTRSICMVKNDRICSLIRLLSTLCTHTFFGL